MDENMPEMYTWKIWDIKKKRYVSNGGGYSTARAPYDCFPEKSVTKIAGRLLGKGNYEVHKFLLQREIEHCKEPKSTQK